jgi:ATP-dependent Lhr-like helicase
VTIVNAADRKPLRLRIEVPVEYGAARSFGSFFRRERTNERSKRFERPNVSIWSSIYPRLLDLIPRITSTLIFVNSRRLAARLARRVNELAASRSFARIMGRWRAFARSEVEDLLKAGRIKALVATSSLELGIDMGAIDLVVQIGSAPSVAAVCSGRSRGHQARRHERMASFSRSSAATLSPARGERAMHRGRSGIDALPAQSTRRGRAADRRNGGRRQLGATICSRASDVRRHSPISACACSRAVLDMLSGRYRSDEFAELRPRVTPGTGCTG